jgi:hypothetical protein
VEWLTFNNIMEWNEKAKKSLIDIGMVNNSPGMICKFLFVIHAIPLPLTIFYYLITCRRHLVRSFPCSSQ